MRIAGLQKLTLLDYPEKVACIVFIGGCNFRCPFCHNASLVLSPGDAPAIAEEEVLSFLKKRKGILDGVCITGGEPLLQADLPVFLEKIKALGYAVKVDTNGSYPDRLKQIVTDGLADYVAMDIKNTPEKYPETVGIPNYDTGKIEESAAFLLSGAVPYEFRTTVVREFHRTEDFEKIGRWLRGAETYFLQGFQDSGDLIGEGLHGFSDAEMQVFQAILRINIKQVSVR